MQQRKEQCLSQTLSRDSEKENETEWRYLCFVKLFVIIGYPLLEIRCNICGRPWVICYRSIADPKKFGIEAWLLLFLLKALSYYHTLWCECFDKKVTKIKKMKRVVLYFGLLPQCAEDLARVFWCEDKTYKVHHNLRNVCLLSGSHRSNFWIYVLLFHC